MQRSGVGRMLAVMAVMAVAALGACQQADRQPDAPAMASGSSATATAADSALAPAAAEDDYMAEEQKALEQRRARAAADPVAGVIERAEICLHFGGEEAFDDARRAQIERAFENNMCDTVVADGDALIANRPQDAARIAAAIEGLRL